MKPQYASGMCAHVEAFAASYGHNSDRPKPITKRKHACYLNIFINKPQTQLIN